ncbi:MFS general substrate transporter [Paraphaeosphaeria sporulosa]|uniref:MFS general substrate transporter n=1 Tax=Paraphaeosphaeria sporulosa TaxID=1460663 RepID=A0A177C649_9PLEO|nr:MFS general substrate transporter [Paraphaeosphaeria sporulosa]OAG03103.1 MFS general substrate transporter [Paraphaeosphaeria sporulosa]
MSARWSTPMLSSDSTFSTRTKKIEDLEKASLSLSIPTSAHCIGYKCEKYESCTASYPSTANSSDVLLGQPPRTASHPSPPSKNWRQELPFIFITCIAQFLSLSALNQTVSPVMVLAKHFRVEDYGNLSWFSASYSMSVGTFILPAGRLGDMYGHKKIYLIGWLWFAIWSIITGFAYTSNHVMFSICRALQGIGPALLVPNAVALIGRTLPVGKQRMIGFACFGASGPLGATAGAVFSALLAELAWWPWMFWVLAVLCLIVMGLAYMILPEERMEPVRGPINAKPPTFDYWGTITGVSGLVLINTALNQAPLVLWTAAYVSCLLGAGCVLMVVFFFVELYATNDPLIPIRGLGKDTIFALTCIVTGWASHGIWAYYLYLFLEQLRGHSAILTSAQTSPVAITGVLFAFSTVWLIQRFGVSYVMFIAMTCFMVGVLLLATMPIHQSYWLQAFLSILIMPGAMNLSYPAANMLLSSALPREKQGIAASLVSTMVNYSISCGLGVAGTIDRYVTQAAAKEAGIVHPPPLSDESPELMAIRLIGFRASFWFAVAFSATGMAIASVFIGVTEKRKRALRREANVA